MENEIKNSFSKEAINELVRSWRFWRPALAIIIGGIAGYLYYHFVGCSSGSCGISSNPYFSVVWGSLIGYFLVNSPCSRGAC